MTRQESQHTAPNSASTRRGRWTALVLAAVMAMTTALPLAACGKKGDPEPPPGAKDQVYPRPYPDPKSY
jgi:predicted small lipoprotein YifL